MPVTSTVPPHRGVPRILAGAPARDRRAIARPGSVARWFEPFHIRQPQVARGELAAQVAAGADLIVAPAWLTHHRALEPLGESRRARAWTSAAVQVAREAVDQGLERRAEAIAAAAADTDPSQPAADPMPTPAGPVLVLGPLPDVAARPEGAHGRLLPVDAAASRDLHDQAGLLADAEVDGVLIEPRRTTDELRDAVGTVVDTGRPAWVLLGQVMTDVMPLPELLDALAEAGAERVLLPDPDPETFAMAITGPHRSIGAWWSDPTRVPEATVLDALVDAGADVLALATDATVEGLGPLVAARDRAWAARLATEAADADDLRTWLREAARRAPGGRALWVGPRPGWLPDGFAWTIGTADTLAAAPESEFRLVATDQATDPRSLARAVAHGGIVAFVGVPDMLGQLSGTDLEPQVVEERRGDGIRIIARRAPG